MAKAPETPRRPKRRRRRSPPERRRSNAGRVIGAGIALATAGGVGAGLNLPFAEAPGLTCGGTERWSVKLANDPDALGGKIDLNPSGPFTVAAMNQILPGPLDAGGRMAVEKKQYTVRGFLSYFKDEDDDDYHVVITDKPGDFARGKGAQPNGRSMVVELPDPACFRGHTGQPAVASSLNESLSESRLAFDQQTKGLSGTNLNKPIPVTVTGVGFFDFDHGQTGRATPHPWTNGQGKVFELHPVTQIMFDNAVGEPD